jgi:hypothetical protein
VAEHLHAMVPLVAHDHPPAVAVHRKPIRELKLAILLAFAAKLKERVAGHAEDLDAVVLPVDDIDVLQARVHGQAHRPAELTWLLASAKSYGAKQTAGQVQLKHAIGIVVAYQKRLVGAKADVGEERQSDRLQ